MTHDTTCEIAGIKFNFLRPHDVLQAVIRWRADNRREHITLTNPHSVMLCRRDEMMRRATRYAGLTLPDGVGIVLAARLLGYGRRQRLTGPSLMLEMCDLGRRYGIRHFFYGGVEGVAESLAQRMQARFPGLRVVGTHCPPFRDLTFEEDDEIVDQINECEPDVLWVGLGDPKQEKWILAHRDRLRVPAMIGVGAAFDFHTGRASWAPSWIRKMGLEWAHRLACEPKRMWRRNLDSPLFLGVVLSHVMGRRSKRI